MVSVPVITVVVGLFASQENVPGVLVVVVPLRSVAAGGRILFRREKSRAVVIVFKDKMDVAAVLLRQCSDRKTEIVQDLRFTRRDDRMDRIEPQPIETVVAQPMHRILDEEPSHLWHAIVDCATPRCLRVGEELRRDAAEVITFRTEMIVNDVDEYHQPVRVRCIDQGFEIIRAAITRVGREGQNAVIAPVPASRKIREWHKFDCGDSGLRQVIELWHCRAKRPFLRESPGVQFGENSLMPRQSSPLTALPRETVIDDFAGPMHVFGLKVQRRIGNSNFPVDLERVTRAGLRVIDVHHEPAVALWHRDLAIEH